MMLRCSPDAAAVCPDRPHCEANAIYMVGSECYKFNAMILQRKSANFERKMAEFFAWLDAHPEALTMGGAPNV